LPTPKRLLTLLPRRTKPQEKPQPKRFDRNLNQWRQRLPQAVGVQHDMAEAPVGQRGADAGQHGGQGTVYAQQPATPLRRHLRTVARCQRRNLRDHAVGYIEAHIVCPAVRQKRVIEEE